MNFNLLTGRTLWAGVITFFILYSGYSGNALTEDNQNKSDQMQKSQKTIAGKIKNITADMIFLETDEGFTRAFGVKDAAREGLDGLKVGDRILLKIDEGNQIIDIEREENKKADQKIKEHPKITGEVAGVDIVKKEVTLKLKDGAVRSYKLKDAATTKMNNVKMGSMITMEVDEENGMGMDFIIHQ
ncbi:MAG: hypothetical protein ACYDBV_10850 [Nitrospiria bacterium]